MKHPSPDKIYDVIIIGSGISGMTASAILSKAGLSVCVLEMDSRVGGYVAGFRRKDFRFDTAIHWLNQCGPGGLVHNMFSFIGTDFPKPRQQKVIRRMKGDSFDYLLTDSPDFLKEQWIKEFPQEKKGIERFFRDAKQVGRSFKILATAYRAKETMSFFEKIGYGVRMFSFVLPFIKHLRYTGESGTKKGLDKYFKEKKLHDVFCSENTLLSCLVPIGWAYHSDYQMPPEGGSQVFPEWLMHVIRSYGNDVYFGAKVKKILLEGDKCTGVEVELRGKKVQLQSKYVIAACDVETLYEKMLPAEMTKPTFIQKLRKAELYSSSVTLSIALDCNPKDIGFGEELVFLSKDGVPKKEQADGNPHTSGISILAPSLRDPSLAPEGMGTLTLYISSEISYADNWGAELSEDGTYLRSEAYYKTKEEVARVLIDRVEEKYPEFKEHILFYDIATPVTHLRYTGNKNGSIMGARPGKHNMKLNITHIKTPVKNLYLGSQWAELGGGVPIAVKTGANAALVLLHSEKPKLAKSLGKYMDGKQSLSNTLTVGWLPYANNWECTPTPAEKKRMKSLNIEE